MRIKVNLNLVQEEVDNVFGHGVVQVHDKDEASTNLSFCPEEWSTALTSYSFNIESVMIEKWRDSAKFPKFSSALKKKLNKIYLAHDKFNGKCFLLYVFTSRNEVRIFVGNSPSSVHLDKENILKTLEPIYSIHDGYFLLNGGVIHFCDSNEVLEEMVQMESSGFIKIFQCNVDWVVYGMEDNNLTPYIIWSGDEEVEEIGDVFEEIDDWLALRISEYDDFSL